MFVIKYFHYFKFDNSLPHYGALQMSIFRLVVAIFKPNKDAACGSW